MDKKVTKKEMFEILKDIVKGDSDTEITVEQDELLSFLDKQIEMIDAKAEKAKVRQAEKRAAGDELRAVVQEVLTEEYQTVDEVVAKIEGEDITKAKVVARLTSLCKAEIAEKTDVKSEDGRKVKAYRLK